MNKAGYPVKMIHTRLPKGHDGEKIGFVRYSRRTGLQEKKWVFCEGGLHLGVNFGTAPLLQRWGDRKMAFLQNNVIANPFRKE